MFELSKCGFIMCLWRSPFGNTVNYRGRIWLFDYCFIYKFGNIDIIMCFWRFIFRNTVNYGGRVRVFDYSFVYKFANVDYTSVFEGRFSKTLCFFSQAPPKCRAEPSTSGRVFFHMEIRTLNARGMFREKYMEILETNPDHPCMLMKIHEIINMFSNLWN